MVKCRSLRKVYRILYHVVNIMGIPVKMDKQGRIIVPANVRNRLGITEKTDLEVTFGKNQITIRRKSGIDLEELKKWKNVIKNLDVQAFVDTNSSKESKWYSDDYVRSKLGLDN